jgi:hypothetical protein
VATGNLIFTITATATATAVSTATGTGTNGATLLRLVYGGGIGESYERERRPRDPRRAGTPFAGLSPRIRRPHTPNGLLLYQSGEVIVTPSWDTDPRYWTADDRIAGGVEFVTYNDTWQATVLKNNGYTLVPVT